MDLKPDSTHRPHVQPLTLLPFKIRRELNYALWFVFLVVSSVALLGLLSPLEPRSLLRFGILSEILPRQEAPARSCDYSRGRWVLDVSQSSRLYNESCPFLDPGFRCRFNGRKDLDYLNWRWQPDGCDLPRFNATELLDRTRNGRIVFAGDSIGRNQWESLICMLSTAVSNRSSIYEENGNPITKHKGYLSIRFQDYNLTVEYYRTPFLVRTGRPPVNSSSQVRIAIRIDELHWYSSKWVGADVMVFNAGHWWNPDKTTKMGCYFQEGEKINMTMDVKEAFQRSILTWKLWTMKNLDPKRTRVFFRSYSPVHYSNGKWDEGGKCSRNMKPDADYLNLELESSDINHYVSNVIDDMDGGGNRAVQFLNITFLTEPRKDAHPSNHREAGTPPDAPEDCSHWCLPGVPDTWNELLYAHLLSS